MMKELKRLEAFFSGESKSLERERKEAVGERERRVNESFYKNAEAYYRNRQRSYERKNIETNNINDDILLFVRMVNKRNRERRNKSVI